jgi:hypothetical protein
LISNTLPSLQMATLAALGWSVTRRSICDSGTKTLPVVGKRWRPQHVRSLRFNAPARNDAGAV